MVINQIHAIGDLIFLEPMYRHFWKTKQSKPVVPVRDHLVWLTEYIDSAIIVPMSEFTMDYENREPAPEYLPLRWANHILHNTADDDYSFHQYCMPDKYVMAGLDPSMWVDLDITFNRKRAELLFNFLKLDEQEYVLVNRHSQAGYADFKVNTDLRIVEMESIPGFTVIDWYLVMLRAKENHHVSTSTFYILQAIKNKFGLDTPVYIYPRPNWDGLKGIEMLHPTYNLTRVHKCG